MKTIKAFHKGLRCRDFQYEVGKTYEMPREKVEICASGFHASRTCDIGETLRYYPISSEYCLVDIDVVDEEENKVVGNKIKIIKKLSLDECIEYDKTGWWCYRFAEDVEGVNINRLQEAVIEKDKTGELCYYFAIKIKGADIERLQEAVIEKDKTGKWCYWFAIDVERVDIERLQDAVIEKDKTGKRCYYFANNVEGADKDKLLKIYKERIK